MLDDEPTPVGSAHAKKGAEEFLDNVEGLIENALDERNTGFLDEKERADLEYARRRLRSAFEELVKWFVIPASRQRPHSLEHGFENLWALMACCKIAGSRAGFSESVQNYLTPIIEREKQERLLESARTAKSINDAAKQTELLRAIRDELRSAPFSVSEKFALKLRPRVLKRLGIVEEKEGSCWPSSSKIKNALSEIKKVKT
jgi:hypothetical protein